MNKPNPKSSSNEWVRPGKKEYRLITAVWSNSIEQVELANGCALRFPDNAAWRQKLARFVKIAPGRYEVMSFEMQTLDGSLWLRVTGPDGTRDFVTSAYYLLNSTLNPRKTHKQKIKRAWRRATGILRSLPNFIIFGAMKSGTTSLYSYLIQHPTVASSAQKETYFFNFQYHRGPAYYRSFFPISASRWVNGWTHTGEATPFYIYHPDVPQRIFSLLPDARLIAILRNPVDRAYSHYQHRVRMGLEPLSFAQALAEESTRLGPASPGKRSMGEMNGLLIASGYRQLGEYAEQVQPWLKQFPREQLMIVTSEALANRPADTFRQITRFLGLSDWFPENYSRLNRAPYHAMPANEREQLIEHFRPFNAQLANLLGQKLEWDR